MIESITKPHSVQEIKRFIRNEFGIIERAHFIGKLVASNRFIKPGYHFVAIGTIEKALLTIQGIAEKSTVFPESLTLVDKSAKVYQWNKSCLENPLLIQRSVRESGSQVQKGLRLVKVIATCFDGKEAGTVLLPSGNSIKTQVVCCDINSFEPPSHVRDSVLIEWSNSWMWTVMSESISPIVKCSALHLVSDHVNGALIELVAGQDPVIQLANYSENVQINPEDPRSIAYLERERSLLTFATSSYVLVEHASIKLHKSKK